MSFILIDDFAPKHVDGSVIKPIVYGGEPRVENDGGGDYTGYIRQEGNGQSITLYMKAGTTSIYAIPTADVTAGMCGTVDGEPPTYPATHYPLLCGWADPPGFDTEKWVFYNEFNGSPTACDGTPMTDTDEWKCIPADSFSTCVSITVTITAQVSFGQTESYLEISIWEDGSTQIGAAKSENITYSGDDYADYEFNWPGLSISDLSDFRVRAVADPGGTGYANKRIEIFGVVVDFGVTS